MNTRPLIGITAFETTHSRPPHSDLYALGQRYVRAIEETGGAPVMLPPGLSQDSLRRVFDRLDGLLFSGGGDIDPALYDEAPLPTLGIVSAARDRDELPLARWAIEDSKPVLSICRGIQVLNVALGGSLIQDIPSQKPGMLQHDFDSAAIPHDHIAHIVNIEPHSNLASILGAAAVQVNSWHHQAINRPADGLTVVAHSPDGIIEAVEIPQHRFAIGVQWHPEWLYDKRPEMKRLFAALVDAAKGS
jgi:putative glutamine amidotransferase